MSLLPVWLIESPLFTLLWIAQCFLSLCLVVFAIQQWLKPQDEEVALVEETGLWTRLDAESSNAWKISGGSRVSSLMLWVELSPLMPLDNEKSRWCWIFSDAVSKKDFRRLSRIIIRQQRSHEEDKFSVG